MEVRDLIADGERAAMRWTTPAASPGAFVRRPPTGAPVSIAGMHVMRVRDGRIAETWVEYDSAGFMRTIGVLPAA